MSKIIFMCGPAGSGKSTVAKQLERAGMARLSFDEESFARGITVHPLPAETHAEIEQDLMQRLLRLIQQERDVVLDYSFWSRAIREQYKAILTPFGIEAEIYYVATPKAVALQRIRHRTGNDPNEMQLSEETAARYYDNFEPPTADEGRITIIPGV